MIPLTTVEYADSYFGQVKSVIDWSDFSEEGEKLKGLNTATQMINLLNFKGSVTSAEQENAFPRNGQITVPEDIQKACAELALVVLNGIDLDLETEGLFIKSMGYSNVRSTYDTANTPEHIVAGIPSVRAWNLLKPYLNNNKSIGVNRV